MSLDPTEFGVALIVVLVSCLTVALGFLGGYRLIVSLIDALFQFLLGEHFADNVHSTKRSKKRDNLL